MELSFSLPEWLMPAVAPKFAGTAEAMAWTLELAKRNVREGGGPFAAAVIDEGGRLVAAGCNRVVAEGSFVLHAEMVALMLAQRRLGTHDLASVGNFTLVTSCAPCAMCLGAIPWSGIKRVVCGARSADAEAVGFDEGEKAKDWTAGLRRREIEVVVDVQRDAAANMLRAYAAAGRPLY